MWAMRATTYGYFQRNGPSQVIVSVDQAEKLGETFGIEVCEAHGRFQMPIQTAGT
jgi:hypothetical protein